MTMPPSRSLIAPGSTGRGSTKIISRGLDGADDGELFLEFARPKCSCSTTAG